MEGTEVQALYGVTDEVRQMAFGQPFLQGAWHEVLLVRQIGDVACAHTPIERKNYSSRITG